MTASEEGTRRTPLHHPTHPSTHPLAHPLTHSRSRDPALGYGSPGRSSLGRALSFLASLVPLFPCSLASLNVSSARPSYPSSTNHLLVSRASLWQVCCARCHARAHGGACAVRPAVRPTMAGGWQSMAVCDARTVGPIMTRDAHVPQYTERSPASCMAPVGAGPHVPCRLDVPSDDDAGECVRDRCEPACPCALWCSVGFGRVVRFQLARVYNGRGMDDSTVTECQAS